MFTNLYENIGYGGRIFQDVDQNVPVIPPPLNGQGSSLVLISNVWVTYWETANYDEGDDSLWIEPRSNGYAIANLHILGRPHGNNHWGDRIKAISMSGAPTGSNENRTIVHADGSVTVGDTLALPSSKLEGVISKATIAPLFTEAQIASA